jgi:hypothetical protein
MCGQMSIWGSLVRPLVEHLPFQGGAMKYFMQIYQGDALETQAALPQEEQQRVWADYRSINETPGVRTGEGLGMPDTATTVRVKDGRTLTTDGPFTETKEALGGYFFFETDDLDAALELAARVPAARYGGAVEVRPMVQY